MNEKHRQRGYAAIALDNPKSKENIGSALRGSDVYGAAFVAASKSRYKGASTDTLKSYRHMPLIQCEDVFDVIPYDCVPVAIELVDSAESLVDYKHPQRAYYIFGAEDATLGSRILNRCRDVVYVPTSNCMNLACTVNVVLYDRMQKQLRG